MIIKNNCLHELENASLFFEHVGIIDVQSRMLTEQEATDIITTEYLQTHKSTFVHFFEKVFAYFPIIHAYDQETGKRETVISNGKLANIVQTMMETHDYFNFVLSDHTVIIGNYDCSMPVYSNNEEEFRWIREAAASVSLHVRS